MFAAFFGLSSLSQDVVDIGLFPSASGDSLEVRLRPTADFGAVLSALTFSVRWPSYSTSTLGTGTMWCPDALNVQPTSLTVSGGYQYRTYNGFGLEYLSDWGCGLLADQETVIMRIPVLNNTGLGQFHLVNDVYTGGNNLDYYISFGGIDVTGIVYSEPPPGTPAGAFSGLRFIDEDMDCQFDPEDTGIPYQVMELLPGPVPVITGTSGHFHQDLPVGDYTVDQWFTTGLSGICPVEGQLVGINEDQETTVDFANAAEEIVDLSVLVLPSLMRPGFDYTVHLLARNLGFTQSGAASLTFSFDPQFSLLSSAPTPTSVAANTLQWDIDPLPPFGSVWIALSIQVPAEPALIGALVDHTATVITDPDIDLSNNTSSVSDMVVGSFDPNDKTAFTSSGLSGDQFFIDLDDAITYRIRFQNTGNYPATTVVVTDTIGPELDMSTFEQGLASHPFDVRFLPGRVVEWTFANIELADSVSNEPESHGLVSFRIRPVQPVQPGTAITNTANIYFDFNPPVITEPSVLTAEFSTGVNDAKPVGALLSPNPATDRVRLSDASFAANVRRWEVISSTGATLEHGSGPLPASGIAIGHLENGAYVLRMHTLNETCHERFIKISQ